MIKAGAGPQPTNSDDLVFVEVRRIRKNKSSTETISAKRLGEDIYQIKRSLHLIAGYNFNDIVRAQPVSGSPHPSVSGVLARSGYRTMHLAFDRFLPPSERTKILERLAGLNAECAMLMELFCTLQIGPEADFDGICDYLKSLSSQNLIKYEPEVDIDTLLVFCFTQ